MCRKYDPACLLPRYPLCTLFSEAETEPAATAPVQCNVRHSSINRTDGPTNGRDTEYSTECHRPNERNKPLKVGQNGVHEVCKFRHVCFRVFGPDLGVLPLTWVSPVPVCRVGVPFSSGSFTLPNATPTVTGTVVRWNRRTVKVTTRSPIIANWDAGVSVQLPEVGSCQTAQY